MRRVLGLSLGSAMIMAMAPGVASAQDAPPYSRGTDNVCNFETESSFPDVGEANTHSENIECMADYDLTEGLNEPGNPYGPQIAVNRGQMASFIARFVERATETTMDAGDPNQFDDSDEFVSPHRANINKLAEAGIVQGFADGEYKPALSVNRQQMATFIRNALSYIHNGDVLPYSAPPEWTGGPIFEDAPFVFAHNANINAIAGVGIVQGNRAGYYLPTNPVLRDQMASFIMRAFDYVESDEFPDTVVPEPEPEGPTVDTAFVGMASETDTVSVGDQWELGFSDAIDTLVVGPEADTGASFTVEDGDGDTDTVQCTVSDAGIVDVDADNVEATCELSDDGLELTITLVGTPDSALNYPVTLTATDLMAADDDRSFDLDAEFSDVEIEVNADTMVP